MKRHVVAEGECISSIAEKYGVFWETLWAQNTELRRARTNPNALRPGDVVTVEEAQLKHEGCATDQKHRFLLKGVPAQLRLRLMEADRPRKGLKFALQIDGATVAEGTTDANGSLEADIPPGAAEGVLILRHAEGDEALTLRLGQVHPKTEVSGVQQRLWNLGYYRGKIDGIAGRRTEMALAAFQKAQSLTPNGRLDSSTREKLAEVHGG